MLHEAQRKSAPSAFSVSIKTAVWIVMCNEPAMRAPRSGWVGPNSSRVAIRPGISVSAMAISLRPQAASPRSLTTWSREAGLAAVFAALAVMAILAIAACRGGRAEPIAGAHRGRNNNIKISLCRSRGRLVRLAEPRRDQGVQRLD